MSYAENILAALKAQRCTICKEPAVPGAKVCLKCVEESKLPPTAWFELPQDKQDFLKAAVKAGQQSERDTGVPCCVTVAQAILESAWGDHHMGSANNYFGIKADSRWSGDTCTLATWEHSRIRGWYRVQAKFRAYPDMGASFTDHGRFLAQNKRYAKLFTLPLSAFRSWCQGLQSCGYATDPKYGEQLIGIIERYELQYYNLPQLNPPKGNQS